MVCHWDAVPERVVEAGPMFVVLAYGQRRPDDIAFYPRSSKVYLRGAGIVFRVAGVDSWDGEE